jgi:hypothetical protein
MVCRAASEPCRRCKGQAMRAKAEATMAANGTRRPTRIGADWGDYYLGNNRRRSERG